MKKGSVTVFLSLLLPFLIVFELVVLEAVRIPALHYFQFQAGDASTDNLLAGYTRELFEEYGLLFLDGGQGESYLNPEALESQFRYYYDVNRDNNCKLAVYTYFNYGDLEISLTEATTATDYGGAIFVDNVMAYFPYDAAGTVLEKLKDNLNLLGQGDELKSQSDTNKEKLKGTEWGTAENQALRAEQGEENQPLIYFSQQSEAEALQESEDFDEDRYEKTISDSIIGGTEEVQAGGWLSLVIPKNTSISGVTVTNSTFPSIVNRDERTLEGSTTMSDPLNKVAFSEYVLQHFSDYTTAVADGNLQYQVEYILFGETEDQSNLKDTLNRIMWIREGMNLLTLAKDSEKREAALALAETMVGWSGIPLLTLVVQGALLASWAYAEAILDVKTLLLGKKVPLLKSSEEWTLGLDEIPNLLAGQELQAKTSETGLGYRDYLRMLLYLTDFEDVAYRTMDMIQCHYQKDYPNYRMCNAIQSLTIRVTSEEIPHFTRQALVQSLFHPDTSSYLSVNYYTGHY